MPQQPRGGVAMTAEVAVMNRSAVALAADSAVTLSGVAPTAQVDKIFQNENKLFELSREHPVGIMIYNATSFFDIPWEIIIKDFRSEYGHIPSEMIFDWPERFRDYLADHCIFNPSVDRQRDFVYSLVSQEFRYVLDAWIKEARGILIQKRSAKRTQQIPVILEKYLSRRVNFYESTPYYNGFDDAQAEETLKIYEADYLKAKSDAFGDLDMPQSHNELLHRLAKGVLSRARRAWYTTGLVFAGYGSKEIFPSLMCLEVGGVVNGKLRWIEKRKIDIDRADTTAEIVPFAQRETIDSLLFGRADRYEAHVLSHFEKALRQVGNGVVEQLTTPGSKRKDFEARVDAAVDSVLTNFRERHAQELKDGFANDTLDSVRHMPKPDLAAFAESLVTVTSMMRKASIGPETVGGPIDVAVISRHEGFVWVKRKHYFDAELNRRYVSRAFKAGKGENSDVGAGG